MLSRSMMCYRHQTDLKHSEEIRSQNSPEAYVGIIPTRFYQNVPRGISLKRLYQNVIRMFRAERRGAFHFALIRIFSE